MFDIVVTTVGFVAFTLGLALLILVARQWLVPATLVAVTINDDKHIDGHYAQKLLQTLSENDVNLPSACAGAGTCGLCRVKVCTRVPPANPIECTLLTDAALKQGYRLACQFNLRQAIDIEVPAHMLKTRSWQATVLSSKSLSPFIREIRLQPDTPDVVFEPGNFMQVTAPASKVMLSACDPGRAHAAAWHASGAQQTGVQSDIAQTRAYSLANRPQDSDALTLMVRLALPPAESRQTLPPGYVSSWLFTRQVGDTVDVSGPHQGFHIVDESRELVFIGGGVGMAPLRAMIHRQINRQHTLPMTFFYGARTQADLLYGDEFDALSDASNGFKWTPALSEPDAHWQGERGFIHEVFEHQFLAAHPSSKSCDYYLCGPPLMIDAVVNVLHNAGIQHTHIYKDEFG